MIYSEERMIIMRVVEKFVHSGDAGDEAVNVVILPKNKTSCIESDGDSSRTVQLDEYRINNTVIWAGYSSRSKTVYVSTTS